MEKILIVVDMQNDFINGSLGTNEAKLIVPNVANKIRQYKNDGCNIIFTRDTHFDKYLETQEGKNLPVEHCIKDTHGWHIPSELLQNLDFSNCLVYDKVTFGSKELAEYLENNYYFDEIELVGLCTDICVISNALLIKAFLPEVKITVDASCCAGVTKESHLNALNAMKMCQINIINE